MIKIRNLTVAFDRSTPVVDSMSLDIEAGKTTVIVGESGSGKSVTIAAILRILPKEAHIEGSIMFEEKELLSLTDDEMNALRGKSLGYVPQGGGNSMHPLLTTGTQVAEPIEIHQKQPKQKAGQSAIEWLDRVGLHPAEKIAKAYPHTLSGGMKQRALIAMGAAGGAEMLLADEPTKGLDFERVKQMEGLFKSLHGTTILCVTHDLRFAKSIADSVCVMYGGEAVEFADADSFFADPKHPYSQMLMAALPENGLNCPETFTPPIDQRNGCLFYHRCPRGDDECLNGTQTLIAGNHSVRCRLYAVKD